MNMKTIARTALPVEEASIEMPSEQTFAISRLINAPRALVFKAWTDPKHLAQWWGPDKFTVPVCEMDVRPGGSYRIVMRSPEGEEYPLKGVYRDIIQPERLMLTENWEEHPAKWQDLLLKYGAGKASNEALDLVTFEDRSGKTLLTIKTLFDSVTVRDAMVKMGMTEGWAQSLDRLEKYLAKF